MFVEPTASKRNNQISILTPGEMVTEDQQYMRGHGTYLQDTTLISSVVGVVERVNKLISVKPHKQRYEGEIGDVVVGRITELGSKRWKVDIHARLDGVLLLSSINLPGIQRRKQESDELEMRSYFTEGDLLVAEVQSMFHDGSANLHTRSGKYRKLRNGCLITVPSVLIKRSKSHFVTLDCGVQVILGVNGYIWIAKHVPMTAEEEAQPEGMFSSENVPISMEDRECIARVYNIIAGLASHHVLIQESAIAFAYDIASDFTLQDLLDASTIETIVAQAQFRLNEQLQD
ncbi:hypothetical protein EDD86DRAFT_209151 [Gorgonomyces haynaldii]|nr:hypothetical protein EDD86DRAFT_209151 [Gorgonomyces haynaldii]